MAARAKSLATLLQQSTIDDHEEILQACNADLKQNKADADAQYIRFIALLKLDRYEDALQTLKESGDRIAEKARLERAYALYKTEALKEAQDEASRLKNERGARHLEAQAAYRSEEFQTAAAIYKDLADHDGAHAEDSDIRINSSATDAQMAWQGRAEPGPKKKHTREDLEAFETAYNAGCVSIARGELREGELLLKTARDLCASTEELSEADKAGELLPIKIQQLFLMLQLGKDQESQDLSSDIAAQQISDAATRQVAQHNLQAASKDISNPFALQRALHSIPPIPQADYLFEYQSIRVDANARVADLKAFKSKAVIDHTSKIVTKEGPTLSARTNSLSVLNAAAHSQSQLARLGLKQILPLLSKRPTDIGLAMTIVQLYMLTSNPGAATTILEKLLTNISESKTSPDSEDILHSPGLVALQVSLYGLQGRTPRVKSVLAKASSYWRHKSKSSQPPAPLASSSSANLLRAAGLSLLDSSNPDHRKEAREIFLDLHARDPSSPFAKAGYIAAHALDTPETVAKEADEILPSVSRLIADMDIDALESAGIPTLPSKKLTAASSSTSRKRGHQHDDKAASSIQKKKRRIRKSHLPKDYDPARKPDPERWLPLRERSNYRPKGKKGRRKAEDKTQGGGGGVEKGSGSGGGAEAANSTGGGADGKTGGTGGGGGKSKNKKKGKR